MSADWKKKYMDIRGQFLEVKDVAFRLGYEQGMKDSQMQQMQQQMQQQAAQEAAMMGQQVDENGQPIDPSQDPNAQDPNAQGAPMEEGQEMSGEEMPTEEGQSELDQHINELASLVQKGEKPSVIDMRKAVEAIAILRKTQKERAFKDNSTKVISAQKTLVNSILDKWAKESSSAGSGIDKLIEDSGLNIEIK